MAILFDGMRHDADIPLQCDACAHCNHMLSIGTSFILELHKQNCHHESVARRAHAGGFFGGFVASHISAGTKAPIYGHIAVAALLICGASMTPAIMDASNAARQGSSQQGPSRLTSACRQIDATCAKLSACSEQVRTRCIDAPECHALRVARTVAASGQVAAGRVPAVRCCGAFHQCATIACLL